MNKHIIFVDIDGTLANCETRANDCLLKNPKDWDTFYSRCGEDTPIEGVCRAVGEFLRTGSYEVVLLSGRRESCRADTIEWLKKYVPEFNGHIKLRKNGDTRDDTVVKPEMLNEYLSDNGLLPSDVSFILEDRNKVVRKWRELGYTCFQVAEGDF